MAKSVKKNNSDAGKTKNIEESDESEDFLPNEDAMLEECEPSYGRSIFERTWTTEATRALIHVRGPMEDRFNAGRHKRTTLWLFVTKQLHKSGFKYSAAKVQKKWHNILITYNKNLMKKYRCGRIHWEFFEEMYKYLQGKRASFDKTSSSKDEFKKITTTTHEFVNASETETMDEESNKINYSENNDHLIIEQQIMLEPESIKREIIEDEDEFCGFITDERTQTSATRGHIRENKNPSIISQNNINENSNNANNNEQDDNITDEDDDEDDNQSNHNGYENEEIIPDENGMKRNITTICDGNEDNSKNINSIQGNEDEVNFSRTDEKWWKNYFNQKLETENQRICLQRQMHEDLMRYNKMSLIQQEKIERIKIEAINNLTATLQKLVEAKNKKN